ncbi:unnamed protein product [Adineta steineri]|uniref:EF-hand domain-containing protein n=1 Tax=Adineta steineri TaxID=433720 RepID=A0A815GTB6_9BILA|nr:unnamed protein product [Adineta steineri]CAF1358623.1 unnamed protein product [Adineta steineri]CAF3645474.1 unnamed protein product [Adineta steineri]CAF3711056.1 unnamed protein product [Adineta steineri]
MFTIIPSLYLVAVHYFRQWNAPYYYEENNEEEKKTFDNDTINENNLMKTSDNIQSIESIPICDNNLLLQHDKELLITKKRSSRSSIGEINGYIPKVNNDEDNQLHKVKLRIKKPIRSSSLLNAERQKTYTNALSEDDIMHLVNETGFTREQILLWHSDFLRDCPDGRLSKLKFIDIYKQFYKKGQVAKFCEHAFRVFDKDGSGYIDFVEFLIAVSMTSTKDPVRKTELFFSMYDIDQNGLIDENEMRCVVESIYELMGLDVTDSTRIDMKVQEIFAKAECDQSGYLTKDQFALACKNDRHIRKLLVPNTKAPNNR